jgi:hypothetical protein
MTSSISRRRFIVSGAAALGCAPFIGRGATGRGFEIGLVADAQYADIDPMGTRYYREGLTRLAGAVEHFNRRELAFCVHLGDLIDREWRSFDAVLQPLAGSRHRWHQLLGNHDFDVLDELKPRVPGRMGMAARYQAVDHAGFRFAVLDTNDVSTYARRAGTAEHRAAERELERVRATHLPQAQSWNGAVGGEQLAWLDRVCGEARVEGRKVILLAHHPVAPADRHNAWNDGELLALIDRHPNVVAWLNGHNHAGNFAERHGVPFVTMHGMVETPDTTAFATATILPDRMIITGHGREPSRELLFRTTSL